MLATIAFSLNHGDAKVLIVDAGHTRRWSSRPWAECDSARRRSISRRPMQPALPSARSATRRSSPTGDPEFAWPGTARTSGSRSACSTRRAPPAIPRGAVYSHRGAYLSALGNALTFGLTYDSIYLWTLPMFHCSGWTYPVGGRAAGGTQVCLRKVEPAQIFRLHRRAPGHAPVRRADRAEHARCTRPPSSACPSHQRCVRTGGAAPPSTRPRAPWRPSGFEVTHLYGATETYGPGSTCVFQPEWNALPPEQRYARWRARASPIRWSRT